ncbi:MAG TPA: ATP-binding cassette domain-containing protein [Myxococcota bacterium]|nr:ATP-binding cassette domain-containing protein [Myxococcota bacterium]
MSKSFGPARPALVNVSLDLRAGEILALLGENGAGKSTLMHVLLGLVRPDTGRLEIAGREVELASYSPGAALRAGVGMVHQHSALVPAMTVPENIALGAVSGSVLFRRARVRARVTRLAEQYALDVPLDVPVAQLSVGQRQRAEILRTLDCGARVIVLDEPTAALTPGETQALFPGLRRLRDGGSAIVFISHKLEEIEGLADRVAVLRRGVLVAVKGAREADARELGSLMLGRDLPGLVRLPAVCREELVPAFALRDLEAPGLREASRLKGVSLAVQSGEIVGVAGIDGNGQRELEEVLAGVRPMTAGRIEVSGRPVAPSVGRLRAAGVSHLSGERERGGLVAGFTIAENLVLKGSYDDPRFFRGGLFDREAARRYARGVMQRFGIEPADPDLDIATLSGGNAQKVAVARELDSRPRVLVAVNPTRGLDVGSARFVNEQLLALRFEGGAVLLVSTELDEVLFLADRIVALVEGRVVSVPRDANRAVLGAILLSGAVQSAVA